MASKNIVKSKTFWFNIFSLAILGGTSIPGKAGSIVLAIANIGLRVLSNQPVNIFPNDE